MSDVKKLSDVLKTSPEVTSLESSDRVLAVDANGNLKRLNKYPFVEMAFNAPAGSWKYILLGLVESSGGSYGKLIAYRAEGHVSFMIDFRHGTSFAGWNQHSMFVHPDMRYPEYYQNYDFVTLTYNGKSYYAMQVPPFPKDLNVYFQGALLGQNKDFGTLLADADVSDVTSVTSFKSIKILPLLTASAWGGVKRYRLTTYAIIQKGGRRNGGHEETKRSFGSCRHANSLHSTGIVYISRGDAYEGYIPEVNNVRQCLENRGRGYDGNLGSVLYSKLIDKHSTRCLQGGIDSVSVSQYLSDIDNDGPGNEQYKSLRKGAPYGIRRVGCLEGVVYGVNMAGKGVAA